MDESNVLANPQNSPRKTESVEMINKVEEKREKNDNEEQKMKIEEVDVVVEGNDRS